MATGFAVDVMGPHERVPALMEARWKRLCTQLAGASGLGAAVRSRSLAPLVPPTGIGARRRAMRRPSQRVGVSRRLACGAEARGSAEKRASPVPVLTAGHMTARYGLRGSESHEMVGAWRLVVRM
jgi:hypothetical protein